MASPKKNSSTTKNTSTYFAVLENNFEYNDEIYQPSGGGQPKKLFKSREKAEAYVVELTFEQFMQTAGSKYRSLFVPFDASYEGETFDFTTDVIAVFNKHNIPVKQDGGWEYIEKMQANLSKSIASMTPDDINTLFTNLIHPLYGIYEIECDPS